MKNTGPDEGSFIPSHVPKQLRHTSQQEHIVMKPGMSKAGTNLVRTDWIWNRCQGRMPDFGRDMVTGKEHFQGSAEYDSYTSKIDCRTVAKIIEVFVQNRLEIFWNEKAFRR